MKQTIEHRLTTIVPAYDEAESVGETVRSLREQTLAPGRIVVVVCRHDCRQAMLDRLFHRGV